MPTIANIEELLNNTTSEWTTLKEVDGRKFTSKWNGNSIFLPAAGYRDPSDLYLQGANGSYWSSSLYTTDTSYARSLDFRSSSAYTDDLDVRFCGRSVRPVLRK